MAKRRKKGDNIQVFLEGRDGVTPAWSLKDDERPVLRKKRVQIKRLAHTTHTPSYNSIHVAGGEGHSRFRFNRVSGKGRDDHGGSLQCTYKQSQDSDKFRLVPADTELLPGYYSWWEADFESEDYRKTLIVDIIKEFGSQTARQDEALSKLQLPKLKKIAHEQCINLPLYIQGAGFHGPHKFSASLSTLIKRYREARDSLEGGGHNIVFRFAGTLRYKYQVSSAVLICCDTDEQLSCYKTLDEIPRFSMDHVLDQNGRVHGSSDNLYIEFDSDSITTKRAKDYCRSFWHQAVFVFFSPSERLALHLEASDGEWTEVWHPICATYGKSCKERRSC